MKCAVERSGPLRGNITVPGDKSISHRAAILSSLSEGRCQVFGYSAARDCATTLKCLEHLGVSIRQTGDYLEILGTGKKGYLPLRAVLEAGNSATTMRLLAGALSSMDVEVTITGDESLSRRPMGRIIEPLSLMGAQIEGTGGEMPPLKIKGGRLKGIEYHMPISSAQVKSTILIAGLRAEGATTVIERIKTRDHTERMLSYMGARIHIDDNRVAIEQSPLRPVEIKVPGDISSAAFFIAAALVCEGSSIGIRGVGINPTRTGFLRVIEKMGAKVSVEKDKDDGFEPAGTVTARFSGLKAVTLGYEEVSTCIDEVPLLALLATQAEGETVITGARELRYKESDRLRCTVRNLALMGANVEEIEDGMVIEGPARLRGAHLDPERDHRIAMMLAVAGLVAEGRTVVGDWEWTEISYPGFKDALGSLGARLECR